MDLRTIFIGVLILVLAASLAAAGYFYLRLQELETTDIPIPQAIIDAQSEPAEMPTGPMDMIRLYFPTASHDLLSYEVVQTLPNETLTERLHTAVTELMRGPRQDGMLNPVPEGTQLQSVFWREQDHCAYISFSPQLIDKNSLNALAEWATIYSIVNTVAEQSSAIREVQILIDGQVIKSEFTTWDWSMPFKPDKTFVRYDVMIEK
ncbi:MAG: GerMN domain-containing protein [Candidatus Hinthialibacter antarcticus]|nr:GerMN domain-containing protein [Candidatus Hinthialibacter antarcticus]